MFRECASFFIVISILGILCVSAQASPRCLKDQKPFELAGDTVSWTMSAAPGSECIQGLRWSYMQIFGVSVAKAPTKGRIAIVGSGFRYFADSETPETDSFTLVIIGKNRHDAGKSTLEVTVKGSPEKIAVKASPLTVVGELPRRRDLTDEERAIVLSLTAPASIR